MNERIRELALEVFSFKYKSAPNELNPGHNMDHLYRFAEMIVLECMDIVDETVTGMVGVNAMENIAKHFGVK